jgi:hypothetical protein
VPPHFGRVTAYLNQCYENRWLGGRSPVPWPPRSPDLILFDFFLWGLMEEMTNMTDVHMRGTAAPDY